MAPFGGCASLTPYSELRASLPAENLIEAGGGWVYVWGVDDTVIPIAIGRSASAALPCHRFMTLEGTGHMPMEERPAELAAAIREFLARPAAVCAAASQAP